MINIYSSEEISIMRIGGRKLANILNKVLLKAVPGVTTLELDQYADNLISESGAKSSFKMEKGYRFATCMCVNDAVVHGLPTNYKLQNGDILGVDIGLYYGGFHADASWTKEIASSPANGRDPRNDTDDFLETGELALKKAIEQCVVGNHVGDISKTIQEIVEKNGYSCVKQLVGHGVGRKLHEDPEIPCYLRGRTENTALIKAGMVLAVEVIYNLGESKVVYGNDDGWTICTRDGFFSGLFEQTIAVTYDGPVILTKD